MIKVVCFGHGNLISASIAWQTQMLFLTRKVSVWQLTMTTIICRETVKERLLFTGVAEGPFWTSGS